MESRQRLFWTAARIASLILVLALCIGYGPAALAYDFTGATSPTGKWATASTEWINKTKGTTQAPYVISTADDLAGLANLCDDGNTFENKFFVLASDIDLGEKPWEPIGSFIDYLYGWNAPFNGTFDGRGYQISGLFVKDIPRDGALFGYIGPKATVRNLRLEGSAWSDSIASTGAAILTAWLDGAAENCVIDGETSAGVSGGYRSYSGIVASLVGRGTVRNVVTFGSVDSKNGLSYAGGIIGYGYASGTIENCVAEVSSLKGGMDAGGIVGGNLSDLNIYNCVSAAASVKANYPGGITAIGAIGENNFWLKATGSQPDYANPYGGNTDSTGRVASRGDLPIVAAAPFRTARVSVGEAVNISTTLYPTSGNSSGITFTWKSANTKVATVESGGGAAASVTGVGVGSTTVTLTMANPAWKGKGRISVSCPVYVTEWTDDPDDPADLPDPGVEPSDPDDEESDEPVNPDDDNDQADLPDADDPGDSEEPGESENPSDTESPEPGETENPDNDDIEEETKPPVVVVVPEEDEGVSVTVVSGTESSQAASVSGLPESVFEADSAGRLVFSSVKAAEIANETWADEQIDEVNPLPVVQASVREKGSVARITLGLKGSSLLADRPESIKVMKIKREGQGEPFIYARTSAERGDKMFTLMKGSHIHTGEIREGDDYTLVLFVKDGGGFDLDASPTRVLDPAVIVRTAKTSAGTGAESSANAGGGGGCGAASGSMLMAGAAALIMRLRRENKP